MDQLQKYQQRYEISLVPMHRKELTGGILCTLMFCIKAPCSLVRFCLKSQIQNSENFFEILDPILESICGTTLRRNFISLF